MEDKIILLDYRASEKIESGLKNHGIAVVRVGPCESLPWQINGHPDLIYHRISKRLAYVAPECYEELMHALKPYEKRLNGRIFEKGGSRLGNVYPMDVPYNLLRMGNRVFGKFSAADKNLLKAIEKEELEFIDVKQGYAKCSVAVTSNNSGITSDRGLLKKLEQFGVNMLYIEPGDIDLQGYRHGFIGGASGLIDNNFFLTGRYEQDRKNEKVVEFVKGTGAQVIFLSEEKIVDVGSIIEA